MIQREIIECLKIRLGQVFKVEKVMLAPSTASVKELVARRGKKITYPLFYLVPQEFTRTQESYSVKALAAKMRVHGTIDSSTTTVETMALVPMDFRFNLVMITDSFDKVLDYIGDSMLGNHGKGSRFNFALMYMGAQIGIQVFSEDTVSVPVMEFGDEEPNQFMIEHSYTVRGYVGSDNPVDTSTTPLLKSVEEDLRAVKEIPTVETFDANFSIGVEVND